MKVINILFVFFLFTSCIEELGNRVVGDNLSIYYLEKSNKDKAELIAEFWKDNDLIISAKQQDLQLVQFNDRYELRLIAEDIKNINRMPFIERKMLLDLQKSISDSLNLKGLQIVLCDSNFEPIFNINE